MTCFTRLNKVGQFILTNAHLNAEEYGILKDKFCFHPNFYPNETLGSLVTVKLEINSGSIVKFKLDCGLL